MPTSTLEQNSELILPNLSRFLQESLFIEGIYRPPTAEELEATRCFLLSPLTVESVVQLQQVYAPGEPLRDRHGLNVRVGNYLAHPGGPQIRLRLRDLLKIADPYYVHIQFELLHPFTDGNGRTGRTVWLYKMFDSQQPDPLGLGFLHRFYYQTLERIS